MTAADLQRLRVQLERHEGRRRRLYLDSRGFRTAGVGRNVDAVPFSDDEIDLMLDNDIARALGALSARLPWFYQLDGVDQRVLANMTFNLGIDGLLGFPRFLEAVRTGQRARAVAEMIDSKWCRQVGDGPGGRFDRADELEQMIGTGQDVTP